MQAAQAFIAPFLPFVVRRSLKTGLRGVWGRGGLPDGPCVLAANHHAWWDGYLLWLLVTRAKMPFSLVMEDAQLGRFSFFKRHGVIGRSEVREALRRLKHSALVIFPEGELRPPGSLGPLHEGAAFYALSAQVPLVPVAGRVVMRGAQAPEAYLSIGEALAATGTRPQLTHTLKERLDALLREIDEAVLAANPEEPLQGYEPLLSGRGSTHENVAWLERLWRS